MSQAVLPSRPTASLTGLRAWFAGRRRAVRLGLEFTDRPDVRYELATSATLLMLLLHMNPSLDWFARAAVIGFGVSCLLFRPLLRRAAGWIALTGVIAFAMYREGIYLDNHEYLILYWVLAIACSCFAPNPERALALSARLLIGLCFGFATFWKLISPDFASGAFFQYTLLTDGRFAEIAQGLGGVTAESLAANDASLRAYLSGNDGVSSVQLTSSAGLAVVARVMAWWTIFIEGAIALLFLLPRRFAASRWRDPFLVVFLLTTYSLAPVVRFAWVLGAMGMMQSDGRAVRGWPVAYAGAILFVELLLIMGMDRIVKYLGLLL